MRVWKDGQIVEIEEIEVVAPEEVTTPMETDKVTTLIEGLSNATTIAQIRDIAKSILESTNE